MRLTPLKPSSVIRALNRMGFDAVRQKGSHIFFRHADGRTTVIPFHKGEDIPRGLLRKILNDIETDWIDFHKYL
ncbi:MAG: type II toxin-antitoxin system HicA family toxin [Candidatus Omnitrophica bacterium]|nr:type II toxin-antitoxin system HicA family toxin [Candidatus Omnitrophota bacterium]